DPKALLHSYITLSRRTAFAGYCVRHVPLYSVLPQARGLRHQSSSWCTQLSWAQTIMPHPTPQEGIGISYGSRLPISTCLGILPEVSRVHIVGLKRDDGRSEEHTSELQS